MDSSNNKKRQNGIVLLTHIIFIPIDLRAFL